MEDKRIGLYEALSPLVQKNAALEEKVTSVEKALDDHESRLRKLEAAKNKAVGVVEAGDRLGVWKMIPWLLAVMALGFGGGTLLAKSDSEQLKPPFEERLD